MSFVTRAASAAQSNGGILPASFDVAAFQKDVALFEVLTEVGSLADSLASQIDDTRLAVGGEAMQGPVKFTNMRKPRPGIRPGLNPW